MFQSLQNKGVRTTDPSSAIVSPDFGDIWEASYIESNFNIVSSDFGDIWEALYIKSNFIIWETFYFT